jgi:hypothetical protein
VRPIDASRYCTAQEATVLLGGLLSVHNLLKLARVGRVRGAIKVGHRVWFLRSALPELVTDLYAQPPQAAPTSTPSAAQRPLVLHDLRGHTTFDGEVASRS